MVNTKGYRRGTRYMFAKKFRKHGVEPLSTFLRVYRRGDIVDVKGNGAFQKGMPHKSYHGRTGRVYNVTPHALGVIVNKRVRNRIIPKRINVRVEHVKHSKCREDFLQRMKRNDQLRKKYAEDKKAGLKPAKPQFKRQPAQPREAEFVKVNRYTKPETLAPQSYELVA
uniref:Large ribosomal subunit protein eL21 n=1 Tax=Aceria tosichella TaxID=561515 RepID=A0A6G1SHH6_9ACAR